MRGFREKSPGLHGHIYGLDGGYVHQNGTKAKMDAIRRLVESGSGAVIQVVGQRRTGRGAFIEECLKSLGCPVERISGTGSFDIQRVLRKATEVRFSENVKVVQGEILSMSSDRIVLKTMDMESVFEIGARICAEIERTKVQVGDVVRIYPEAGLVYRLGVAAGSSEYSSVFRQVPVPEGECIQVLSKVTPLTLDDIDCINSAKELGKAEGYFGGSVGERPREVICEVTRKVEEWCDSEKASVVCGVVLVEHADFLSEHRVGEMLSYRDKYKPVIIFSAGKPVKGLEQKALTLHLSERGPEEDRNIVLARASYYNVVLPDEIVDYYVDLSRKNGMSYTLGIMQAVAGTNSQTLEDVKRVASLFKAVP